MNKKIVNLIAITLIGASTISFVGCSNNSKKTDSNVNKSVASAENRNDESKEAKEEKVEKKQYPLTIKDDSGRTVTLEKKPEKIAAISGTILGPLYAVGGESIAKTDTKGGAPTPEGSKDLPAIGHVANIDVEKLVQLQPDLVLAQCGIHDKYKEVFEQNNIPYIMLEMKSYDDVVDKLQVLGDIVQNQDKSEELIKTLKTKVEYITKKLPKEQKKVAILYVTSKDVSLKLNSSIAGNACEILNIKNIAEGEKPTKMGSDSTPFSMEKIVEQDPDMILVTTMVSSDEKAKETIKRELEGNPAWSGLKAVKEGKIKYLPQKYFLYNPGEKFYESIEYMAKAVYPEVYGDVEK